MERGSISVWLEDLKHGDSLAAQQVWQRYHHQLLTLARMKLGQLPKREADEEDIVQQAFDRFFRGVDAGKFPQLADRDDLWKVLVMLTARQSVNEFHRQTRQKRGGGKVRGESIFGGDGPMNIDQVVGNEPSDEFASSIALSVSKLLVALPEGRLREVAELKMEGATNDAIAVALGCSCRTVERKLQVIRKIWAEEMEGDT